MDKADREIIDKLRADNTVEQMMIEEDKLRRASEHLRAAYSVLLTLRGGADLDEMRDLIEEVEAAGNYYHQARSG